MDPYEALGIDPSFDGDLRVVRNRLVKQYSEVGATPDEERMKAVNLAYETLRDRPAPVGRVVFSGGPGSSFVLDGRRYAVAPRRPRALREPAAVAVALLTAGFLALLVGPTGAVVATLWFVWLAARRWHGRTSEYPGRRSSEVVAQQSRNP